MGNGTVLKIVKLVEKPSNPKVHNWWKLEIHHSRRIVGLQKNYIWHLSNEGSEYDTFDGFVVSAPNHEVAWELIAKAGSLYKDEYDLQYPWIIELVGIDLSSEGDRIIESSFRAG